MDLCTIVSHQTADVVDVCIIMSDQWACVLVVMSDQTVLFCGTAKEHD